MQCPNCRFTNPEGSETCEGCGLIFAKWRERYQTPVPAPPENPAPGRVYQKYLVKKFAIIFGVLLALVLACVFLWPTPEPVQKPAPKPNPSTTPVPTLTPLPNYVVPGPPWNYHGKVLDHVHLNPIGGVQVLFFNNAVSMTASTDGNGYYHIAVRPLSSSETYEVELRHPAFGAYWVGDPSDLSQEARLAGAWEYEDSQQFRGQDGGGGEKEVNFSMYPNQLTEQELMYLHNARPADR